MDNFDASHVYSLINKQKPKFILHVGEHEMKTIRRLKDGLGCYIHDQSTNTLLGYDLQIVDGSCFKLLTIANEDTNIVKNVLPWA